MPIDAETFLRAGLAEGLALETLIAVAQKELLKAEHTTGSTRLATSDLDSGTRGPNSRANSASETTLLRPTAPSATSIVPGLESLSRYDVLGLIGRGGMGEVHRVFDRRLGRSLALKVIRRSVLDHPELVHRFLEEAQTTAQLQHPGIIPIHDMGTLPDGRAWFTMKEVTGCTFGKLIADVHAVSRTDWQPTASGWTLRRLVDALLHVCVAVGYAHSRGVVHRDLKPNNIMVGSHGEVMVLDWGVAKLLRRPDGPPRDGGEASLRTTRSLTGVYQTQAGYVAGTPAYMPPEQALGQVDRIDARSDVYALGALLYRLLSGRSPYSGKDSSAVLELVRCGPPAPLNRMPSRRQDAPRWDELRAGMHRPPGRALPPALVDACERAMSREPDDRFESAESLARELRAWLEGTKREEEARALVARAEEMKPKAAALRDQAAILRVEAARLLAKLEAVSPEQDKLPGWSKEDRAAALEREAELVEISEEQLLQGSLTHAPDLPEAHAALATRYREQHEAAEAAGQDAVRAETLFRQHVDALPHVHADRPGHLHYLLGDGALTLHTDPPGAEVLLHRYVLHNRRLVPRFERSLGTTPLHAVPLPMGSYLCILDHPDRSEVRYPVSIGRNTHWHGVPPGADAPMPIPLPEPGELGPDDCYVPPGWFRCGGDPHQERGLSRRSGPHRDRRAPGLSRRELVQLRIQSAGGQPLPDRPWLPHHQPRLPTGPPLPPEKSVAAGQHGEKVERSRTRGTCLHPRALPKRV